MRPRQETGYREDGGRPDGITRDSQNVPITVWRSTSLGLSIIDLLKAASRGNDLFAHTVPVSARAVPQSRANFAEGYRTAPDRRSPCFNIFPGSTEACRVLSHICQDRTTTTARRTELIGASGRGQPHARRVRSTTGAPWIARPSGACRNGSFVRRATHEQTGRPLETGLDGAA